MPIDDLYEVSDLSDEAGHDDRSGGDEAIFANARLILTDRVQLGNVTVQDGRIVEIGDGDFVPRGAGATVIDCNGDYLMPGMVELHTDNIEKHLLPRPGAMWPSLPAAVAHDMQVIAAGITTVYDSVAVGAFDEAGLRLRALQSICDALEEGERHALFKARHKIHLRCEVAFGGVEELLPPLIRRPLVGLLSVMDHTPGQRQFVNEAKYVEYYQGKHGFTDAEMAAYIVDRKRDQVLHSARNRRYVVDLAQAHGHALASHDDATPDHVQEAVQDKMTIAEFPTTVAAARASHENGLAVLMGAPNLVRGGSHSGNVAAAELAALGYLDILSSDYVPASLIHAAFLLADQIDGIDLPHAVATVTANPARAAGLEDRGIIAAGRIADLVRVRATDHHPIIRGVWRGGERVA
ncbi:MAG: alpha-D-ribose 1-methylphosphonate 5-triphosphate diphosphatase [Alphaproteobacteria bacterium]|nr:alpha-D-ribose 1-methylphosphonate 5-triphosphate diphosphatase [Alphaproteobacteria bacterium]